MCSIPNNCREFRRDLLNVKVFPTTREMGRAAAEAVAAKITELLGEQEEVNMIFAAAPSQEAFLESLIADRRIDSVHCLNGKAADQEAECTRYAALLERYPTDIVCMGIGENGHIAFNDPSVADFSDKAIVKRVKLEQICRMQQVHDGCFASIDEVPAYALTVTIPAIMQGRNLICSAPCATKAEAAARMLRGKIDTDCPAAILRSHDHACVYLDADSGKYLLEEG